MLFYSKAISDLLKERAPRFKQYKEMAVFNVAGHFDKVQRFYDALAQHNLIDFEMCWGSAFRGTEQNLVFLGTEAEVLPKLIAVEAKLTKSMPTPVTVLIKMLALRLRKLHDAIKECNEQIDHRNAFWMNHAQRPVNWQPESKVPQITLDDLNNKFVNYQNPLAPGYYNLMKDVNEIVKFLDRPDLTDEVYKQAYDRHSVMEIMTE